MQKVTKKDLLIFAKETDDRLDAIQADLIELAKPGSKEKAVLVDGIFRELHSLKGAAAVVGLKPVVELTHKLEDIVVGMRDKTMPINQLNIKLLMATTNHLSEIVSNVAVAKFADVGVIINKIDEVLKSA